MTLHGFESHSDRVSRSSRNRERRKRYIYIYIYGDTSIVFLYILLYIFFTIEKRGRFDFIGAIFAGN